MTLKHLKPTLLLTSLLAVLLAISLALILLLKFYSIPFLLLILLNLAIFFSFKTDKNIPLLGGDWLHRSYLHAKWQAFFYKDKPLYSKISLYRLKFFYVLLLLFKDSEESFNLAIDQESPLGINFSNNPNLNPTLAEDRKTQKVKQAYLAEYYAIHKQKQKKATITSFLASGSAIIASVFISLIITVIYSHIFPTSAATFGWIQTNWSGGASTTAMASHPGDKSGWTKYYSASANLTLGADITANAVASTSIQTSNADFAVGTTTNAYVTSGSVTMLKPTNATCSVNAECVGNFCSSGICFNCGVDTVAYDGGPYDANGISTTTGGYYRTVLIGTQCWLKDNLNAGTMIGSKLADNTTLQDQTNNSVIEKYCYNYVQQGNAGQITSGTADCKVWGGLYEWPEAIQYSNGVTTSTGTTIASGNIQGICPTGWHLPSDAEYTALSTVLGGDSVSSGAMKETTLAHWTSPNTGATNSSGFTAFGSGYRYTDGSFFNRGTSAYFWSTLPNGATFGYLRYLFYYDATLGRNLYNRADGFSVRCLKGL